MKKKFKQKKLTLFSKTFFLVLAIICIQSISCSAVENGETVCSHCCLVPGAYDSFEQSFSTISYYKEKGGLQQVQMLYFGYCWAGGCATSNERYKYYVSTVIKCISFYGSYGHVDSECIPCLTLPQSDPLGEPWPRISGTIYGTIHSTICGAGGAAAGKLFDIRGYPILTSVECIDNSIDTDQDGIVDCEDNCPWQPNPNQEDCDGDGRGNACDCDINLTTTKTQLFPGESTAIAAETCNSGVTWTVSPDSGVNVGYSVSSTSVTLTALSGQGSVNVTATSDANCTDTTTIIVGCGSCSNCDNTDLNN